MATQADLNAAVLNMAVITYELAHADVEAIALSDDFTESFTTTVETAIGACSSDFDAGHLFNRAVERLSAAGATDGEIVTLIPTISSAVLAHLSS